MRTAFINADPPGDMSFSAALYTDEGFKIYEPRNLELFGDWKWTPLDEYPGWKNQSPLSVYTYALVFKLLGVNFFSIRILSVIYSMFTLLLLYFFIKRNYGKDCANLSSVLYAANYFLIMYNRIGFYETHLNFYLMAALFAFTEAFADFRDNTDSKKSLTNKILFRRIILILTGTLTLASAFFIKKSVLLAVAAVLPCLIIIFLNKYFHYSSKKLKKQFSRILLIFGIFYIIFAHIKLVDSLFDKGILNKISFISALIEIFPDFDPIYLMIGKALFIEAVFLQPLTFFTAIIYAIYSFQKYLNDPKIKNTDFILSSWLIFGFLMLTLLEYHPSRYYMLISIPLVILCSRSVTCLKDDELKLFILNKQGKLFGIFKLATSVLASVYVIITLAFQVVPFKSKKALMHWIYREAESGFPDYLLILICGCVFISAACLIYIIFKKKYMRKILSYSRLPYALIILILIIQLFQYGKWALFHENKMINISKELSMEIEPNAVVAGSWSAGLVIESKNPAIIVQKDLRYNASLLEDLIHGKEIPVSADKKGSLSVYKNDAPVYFAVSPGTTFEKNIFTHYKQYFNPDSLFKTIGLGYFDVQIFKIQPGKNRGDSR
ncbi:MAG: glycosyltransferase family 39 protein [Spirochaetota bacterium]